MVIMVETGFIAGLHRFIGRTHALFSLTPDIHTKISFVTLKGSFHKLRLFHKFAFLNHLFSFMDSGKQGRKTLKHSFFQTEYCFLEQKRKKK